MVGRGAWEEDAEKLVEGEGEGLKECEEVREVLAVCEDVAEDEREAEFVVDAVLLGVFEGDMMRDGVELTQ